MDPPTARPWNSMSGSTSMERNINLVPISSQRKLEPKDLPSVRRLGKGLSGFIYETTWDGHKYARKDFPLRSVKHVVFEKEVSVLLKLDHPNIVKCFDYTFARSSCSLLQEYADDDLQNAMQRRMEALRMKNSTSTSCSKLLAVDDMNYLLLSKVNERDNTRVHQGSSSGSIIPFEISKAVDIISQIAAGVKFLHDNEVIHGDLKPKNVLVCSESGATKVKVADFGLIATKKMVKLAPKRTQNFEILMWKAPERFVEFLGPMTEDSDDPFTDSDTDEDVSHDFNFKFLAMADVYSFGLTCSYILGGNLFFPSLSLTQLRKLRMHGFRPELPSACPQYLKSMIRACLLKEPSYRPTFSTICLGLTWQARPSYQISGPMNLTKGLTSSVEQMEPMITEAFNIINNVLNISSDVRTFKPQCKQVANRFKAIRRLLGSDDFQVECDMNSTDYLVHALDKLLLVLRKGQVLVLKNYHRAWSWSLGTLLRTWTNNLEVQLEADFKEIHRELNVVGDEFPLFYEGPSSGETETSEEISRSPDAVKVLSHESMLAGRDYQMRMITGAKTLKPNPERLSEHDRSLPSYLKVDPSTVAVDYPIRESQRLSELHRKKTLGSAGVHKGTWLDCKCDVKVFTDYDQSGLNTSQNLSREVGILMKLHHPHIIQLLGFAQDARQCYLITESMSGDVRHFMERRPGRPFSRSEELEIIMQIAKGMYYLHTQGYVHCNLKCSNILFRNLEDYIDVKIGGLEHAQRHLEPALAGSSGIYARWPRWTPPEVFAKYGGAEPSGALLKRADVYSFAMTCYEVVTGKYPFDDLRSDALLQQMMAGVRPELPDELDSELKGLIELCWSNDPNMRPEFKEICNVLDHIKSSAVTRTKKNEVWDFLMHIPTTEALLNRWRGRSPAEPQFMTWTSTVGNVSGYSESAAELPEYLSISPTALKFERKIGQGYTSTIYKVTWLGCTFALKRMRTDANCEGQRELDLLIQLRHPYIVQLVGYSVGYGTWSDSILMELMDCSLHDLIRDRRKRSSSDGPFEYHQALHIIKQIALAMVFLHLRGVSHRDLKSPNVLCKERGGSIDVKIADFGTSEWIDSAHPDKKLNVQLGVGTGFWRAPEIFPRPLSRHSRDHRVNLKAADVYSFAMTCCEIVTGRLPYEEYGIGVRQKDEVVQGLRPTLPLDLNPSLGKIITECWAANPEQRPSFSQIHGELQKL